MDYKYLVCISCPVYNHKPFIGMAMDGFCMQKTNFPFVAVIVDDASTDGTCDVIKKYLEENFIIGDGIDACQKQTDYGSVFFLRNKNNPNCYFAVVFLQENHYSHNKSKEVYREEWTRNSKYMAICEGDDYWIDPLKLKMQVEYMESSPSTGMCYTKCRYFYQDKMKFASKAWGGDAESFERMIQSNPVPTASALFRQELRNQYENEISPSSKGWMLGDYPFWIWIAKEYGVKFINEETCVYRVLEKSASHRDDKKKREEFIRSVCDIQIFFADKYHQSELVRRDKAEMALLMEAYSNKDYKAVMCLFHTIKKPSLKSIIKYLFSVLMLNV